MNIIVCAKQIEATYARTGRSPEEMYLNPEDHIYRVNPYDEAAMALAAKVKEAMPEARITVITLAPMKAEEDLWRLMGMGADRLCRIDPAASGKDPDKTTGVMDSWTKAKVLARAADTLNADLILCGKESADQQNGLVAAYMAHLLELPYISGILDLQVQTDRGARITKNAGKGRREIMDCRFPALFSVDLPPGPLPMPAFAAIQAARRKEVLQMIPDTGTSMAKTRVLETTTPRPRSKPTPAPDSSLPSFERVKQLLAGSALEKKGELVIGSPESQVEKILDFMRRHDVLLPDTSD
jgi:electron transfer flavoprotein beta subunit